MQKVVKKRKKKEKVSEKSNTLYLKINYIWELQLFCVCTWNRTKGAWAVLKCTFLSYVTRPSARLIHKNMYTWGIWAATVQWMQQEPLTLKDLTEMNKAVAWGYSTKGSTALSMGCALLSLLAVLLFPECTSLLLKVVTWRWLALLTQ